MAYGTATTTKPIGGVNSSPMGYELHYHPFGHAGLGRERVAGSRKCGGTDMRGIGQVSFIVSDLRAAPMVVRLWAGGSPQVMKEIVANQTITADTATVTRFESGCHKGNKMYWVASVPFGLSTATQSTHHLGIWVLAGRMWIQTSQFLWTTSLTLSLIRQTSTSTHSVRLAISG